MLNTFAYYVSKGFESAGGRNTVRYDRFYTTQWTSKQNMSQLSPFSNTFLAKSNDVLTLAMEN